MLCEKCGREISYHATFCFHCGAKQERPTTPIYPTEPVRPMAPVTPAGTVLQDFTDCSNSSTDEIVTAMLQAEIYKMARRKLFLRIGTVGLFLILSLISSIGRFDEFLLVSLPLSFWASVAVTYLLGDGIRGLFSKIGTAIAAALAWILAFFVYGIILVLVLAGIALLIACIFEAIPTALLNILVGLLWYGGVILTAIFGIRNYVDMHQYKDSYEQIRDMVGQN